MRRAARRDANEGDIVSALERAGALVLRLNRFDLLVYFRGRLLMMDAKMPAGRATMAQKQLSLVGWPLHFVHDVDEALRLLGVLR